MAGKKRPSKKAQVRRKKPWRPRPVRDPDGVVSFTSRDEVIVCRPEMEETMLKTWFYEQSGRVREDYVRHYHNTGIARVGLGTLTIA